jgi:hypothetical protein
MDSAAFLLLANSSPEIDKNQIFFRTIDFQPHQPSFTPVFESMDRDMDLTIGSLNFRVGSLGSIRLSDPAKPDPSASETKTIAMEESLTGSFSEANSPVSLATKEPIEGRSAEVDEKMANFEIEDQLEDLTISHDDIRINQQTAGRQG